ncbi:MAG: BamA/TamA family outer membrane protein [Thermonemataceae bacterium]
MAICLTSCFRAFQPSKNLAKNEYLLHQQQVEGLENVKESAAVARFRQKSNRRLLGVIPYGYVNIYFWGKNNYNRDALIEKREAKELKYNRLIQENEEKPKKVAKLREKRDKRLERLDLAIEEGNWLMRTVGEPPAIFDLAQAEETKEDLKRFLATKGFFEAAVALNVDTVSRRRKLIRITYDVTENNPHLINKYYYKTSNPTIDSLIATYPTDKISYGVRYDRQLLDNERDRLEKLLRNNGFFYFSKNYITIQVDTGAVDTTLLEDNLLIQERMTDVRFVINNPQKVDTVKINRSTFNNAISKIPLDEILGEHVRYNIKDVYFVLSSGTNSRLDTTDAFAFAIDDEAQKVKFSRSSLRFSPKVLDTRIFLRPGDLYSEDKRNQTQAGIFNLNMFKSANLLIEDDRRGNLTPIIISSPLEKYSLTNEVGLNVTQVPGPFINFGLKNRNTFGGCETFENSLTFSINGQASIAEDEPVYSTTEIGFNSSIILPQIFFPTKFKYKFNALNPNTRFTLGFNFVNRPEYTRRNLRLAMIYTLQKIPKHRYNLTPIDFNIVSTNITPGFQEVLDSLALRGSTLNQSFQNALITSTNGFYEYSALNYERNVVARYFKIFGEAGGTSLNYLDQAVFGNDNRLFGLNCFKFLKASIDFRYYYPITEKSTLVSRIFTGGAFPYDDSETLPYEKFFFSGGSNSIRAWQPRRLGPGSFDHLDENGDVDYTIEQPGNIILETNLEWRFKVWSFMNMALFIDAGNVWTLEEEEFRQGGAFSGDFLQDIAVGTGIGFRFDFTFLVFRFDLGFKTIDPARPVGSRWVLDEVFDNPFQNPNSPIVFNIGIGYPF